MLSSGKCIFILDGFDEVVDDGAFAALVDEIRGVISRYRGNKFVVTARPSGWRGGLGSLFQRFDVLDLTNEQVTAFVNAWYEAIEINRGRLASGRHSVLAHARARAGEKASSLIGALDASPGIAQLAKNPLLLSIICFVHYNKALPKERLSLYSDCARLLLIQWDLEKGLAVDDTQLTSAQKQMIMQELAYALHSGAIAVEGNRKEAALPKIIEVVQRLLRSFGVDPNRAEELFRKLVDRSGLMVSVDDTSSAYAFSHLTFQEYYTALFIHEHGLDVLKIVEGDTLPAEPAKRWWREVILLVSTMKRDPTSTVKELLSGGSDDITRSRLQLVAQCLAEAPVEAETALRDHVLAELMEIRTRGLNRLAPRDSASKEYLLNYANRPRFADDVVALEASRVKDVSSADKFVNALKAVDLMSSPSVLRSILGIAERTRIAGIFDIESGRAAISRDDVFGFLNAAELWLLTASSRQRSEIARLCALRICSIVEKSAALHIHSVGFALHIESVGFALLTDSVVVAQSSPGLVKRYWRLIENTAEAMSRDEREEVVVVFRQALDRLVKLSGSGWVGAAEVLAYGVLRYEDQAVGLGRRSFIELLKTGSGTDRRWCIAALARRFGADQDVLDSIARQLQCPFVTTRVAAIRALLGTDGGKRRLRRHISAIRGGTLRVRFPVRLFVTARSLLTGRGPIGVDGSEQLTAASALVILGEDNAEEAVVDVLRRVGDQDLIDPSTMDLRRIPDSQLVKVIDMCREFSESKKWLRRRNALMIVKGLSRISEPAVREVAVDVLLRMAESDLPYSGLALSAILQTGCRVRPESERSRRVNRFLRGADAISADRAFEILWTEEPSVDDDPREKDGIVRSTTPSVSS
jgi:hypothetical protein